jgi:sulfonate transport system substrate-binding protein
MTTSVRIGGVPEHFNYSWHKLIEQGSLLNKGIEIQWSDYAGGTGAMAEGLQNGKIDIAIMLTEGAVSAIAKGCPARIAHFAVDSPLVWGIHTGFNSALKSEDDIQGKTFAISRYGSGSHLMAIVQAYQKGWPLDHMNWLEVKNIDGAKEALVNGDADVFLWERYTTKPLVDEGVFRLIGLLPTPWPAFVLVVSNDFIKQHAKLFATISSAILTVQAQLKASSVLSGTLAQRYKLQESDVIQWLEQTTWSSSPLITFIDIERVGDALVNANVLTDKPLPESILL